MRLHLPAFPHTRVTASFSHCAYTAKILKFVKMMASRGHEIILYAPEGSDAPGATFVEVLSEEERFRIFGADDLNRLAAWPEDEQWRLFNARTIAGLLEHAHDRELVLLPAGRSQKVVADALPHLLHCEPGVGYEGIFTPYCAFESYAWMHYVYGRGEMMAGRWYDAVIPNYFDPEDFPILNDGKGEYLLFLGRLIASKGPHVAAQIANELDLPLLVAGAGATEHSPGRIVAGDVTIEGPKVEYIGPVGVEERAKLLAGARALLAPTDYREPFGGVAVEAMMAGTPAITTDWGAFTETVFDGVSGFRFRSLAEGIDAVERATELDPQQIRDWAFSRYSLEAVAPQFEVWLERLGTLWDQGWATLPEKAAA